jgi:hypothetical protein
LNKSIHIKKLAEEEAGFIYRNELEKCKEYRKSKYENAWQKNESTLYLNSKNPVATPTPAYSSLAEAFQLRGAGQRSFATLPRVMQNMRFLHSQMSANPPSVIPQATSNELSDKRATEAVTGLIYHGRRNYNIQEYVDLTALSTLTYGTGFLKVYHDPHAGKVLSKDGDKITMTGDEKFRPILIWDMWVDPDAMVWEDVRYIYERKLLPYAEAVSIWPEAVDIFKMHLVDPNNHPSRIASTATLSNSVVDPADNLETALVELYERTERAMPENGMLGRRCWMTSEGEILGELEDNPHPNGQLPYGILTDIDIPGEIYGATTVDYAIGLSQVVDTMLTLVLNNVDLFGAIKLVVFSGSDTNETDYSNDGVDIITVNGPPSEAPYQLKPQSSSSDVYSVMDIANQAIDGIMGVNELLQGQVNRELSGFASQTAINAANMVRHRVFNKYTSLVKFVYTTYVDSVRKNWKVKHQIEVVGKDGAPTLMYLDGNTIKSGTLLTFEYGTDFSLDPAMRRDEIMQAKELLVEAGVSPKQIVRKLRYNEIDDLFDINEIAHKRQLEIFERAIKLHKETGRIEIEPANKMRKAFHLQMAEAAVEFAMSPDFLSLDPQLQNAIYDHIDEREQLAAQTAQPGGEQTPPPDMVGAPPSTPQGTPEMAPLPDIGGVL